MGAELKYTNLQNANLWKADLRGADLEGANLQGADLTYAELRGANFKRAVIRSIDLSRSNLQDANIRDADILDGLNNDDNWEPWKTGYLSEKTKMQLNIYLINTEFRNDITDNGDETVTYALTGLMCKKEASSKVMKFNEVQGYIDELNSRKFAEYSDWRLPTLEELAPLTESQEMKETISTSRQRWYWTADKREFGRVWAIDFWHNHVSWLLHDEVAWVRAVRSFEI